MLCSEYLLAILGVLLFLGLLEGTPLLPSASCSDTNIMQSWGCWWFSPLHLYFGVCGNTLLSSFVLRVVYEVIMFLLPSCSAGFMHRCGKNEKLWCYSPPSCQKPLRLFIFTIWSAEEDDKVPSNKTLRQAPGALRAGQTVDPLNWGRLTLSFHLGRFQKYLRPSKPELLCREKTHRF